MFNLNESHFWGAFKLTMRRPPKHASFISNISFKLKPQYTSTKQILAMPGFWEILLAPPFPQCTTTLICHLTNWLGSDKLNPFQICMPVISLPSSYSYFSCSGSSSQRKFDFKAVLPIYIDGKSENSDDKCAVNQSIYYIIVLETYFECTSGVSPVNVNCQWIFSIVCTGIKIAITLFSEMSLEWILLWYCHELWAPSSGQHLKYYFTTSSSWV